MIEVETARQKILLQVQTLPSESVKVSEAAGRFLSRSLVSPRDLPPFDNAAIDGYALRAADLAGASAEHPVRLQRTAAIPAGQASESLVAAGTCVRIFTGSPLPPGADAAVPQEATRLDADNSVLFLSKIRPWENVRFKGEDVRSGGPLLQAGGRLGAAQIALLSALGETEVVVGRRPRVALLATGNELREPGSTLRPGQIHESNRAGLAVLTATAGGIPQISPLTPDNLDAVRSALAQALEESDIVVTSGGVSVGDWDFVKPAIEAVGGKIDFWKIAMKPGKPFVFGQAGGKLIFGLPGNPVSALVTFALFVRPALWRAQGAGEIDLPVTHGILAEKMTNPGPRRHFARVLIDRRGEVRSPGFQASHALGSMARSNGLLDLPPDALLEIGSPVRVLHWEG